MEIYAPLHSDPLPGELKIEVASSFQLPGLQIIGLPAPEILEAKERIRAALEATSLQLPKRRVVLNLTPASIRKHGTGLDLAMALAILSLRIKNPKEARVCAWGEVGLDGKVKPAGQLTRAAYAAWQGRKDFLFVSNSEFTEAEKCLNLIEEAKLFPTPKPQLVAVTDLKDAWHRLENPSQFASNPRTEDPPTNSPQEVIPNSLLALPPVLERSVSIAALGGHNLYLLGPKGTGKSHALEWLISLRGEMPPEAQIFQKILAELNPKEGSPAALQNIRRITSSVRPAALIGSFQDGSVRPGEFSLAHGGLLIADEFPEWARDSREALREPLERGRVTFSRSKKSFEFPARFTLAATGNLCPCGGWPPEFPVPADSRSHRLKLPRCQCSLSQRRYYSSKVSGPILDRIDMVMLVTSHHPESPSVQLRETLAEKRAHLDKCREILYGNWSMLPANLQAHQLERLLLDHSEWIENLNGLQVSSMRSRHKVLRIALSLAAWDGQIAPSRAHFIEASCYRPERFGLCE